jgi:predicted alternative tryptophan synthase beta-subunit
VLTPIRLVFRDVSTRPATLSAAAAVEALEGAAVLAIGLYVGVEAIIGRPHDLASAVALALMAVLAGIGILAVGRGLWQVRRWGRAPALLTQIFAVIVAVSMIQSGRQALGAILIVVAVAGAAALLSPPTTRALLDD